MSGYFDHFEIRNKEEIIEVFENAVNEYGDIIKENYKIKLQSKDGIIFEVFITSFLPEENL